jgi:CubicO group peptidase (beta-lactamase class C family)
MWFLFFLLLPSDYSQLSEMPSSLLEDPDFLACVDDVQTTFSSPGVALAVIDTTGSAGPPILTKGFGELSSGPVTGESVFCIASNTKLFVAVGLGILVEEGMLSWDSKVKDLLPDLHFSRRDAQETITIADMLSHQTGLSG